jgi:hypothetical protein
MTEIIEVLDLPDDEVRRRIAAMTMEDRQRLIDDFRRVGQIEIADHLQQLLDEAKRSLN